MPNWLRMLTILSMGGYLGYVLGFALIMFIGITRDCVQDLKNTKDFIILVTYIVKILLAMFIVILIVYPIISLIRTHLIGGSG